MEDSTIQDTTLPAKRRADILNIAKKLGQITVTDMSARFEVSLDTIRRDLDILADQGLLDRTHGGAIPRETLAAADSSIDLRTKKQSAAKHRIGQAAARLILDGETLIINGGSTTVAFVECLTERRELKIVTNNLNLLQAMPQQALRSLYIIGGEVRSGGRISVGPVGFVRAATISADTAVIGVGGLTTSGCSVSDLAEAGMIGEMMAAARRVIIVADSSKFGRYAFAGIAPLAAFNVLVTDQRPPEDLMQALEKAHVEVVIAG
ncbi:MAG: DeoR/GlpR family DNA-binding transcription regulator [Ancalomicrobiaceae bacterium]|nr:DeoR/GlpR family DNA-binding transcription regulator [Ancalomicrobiaceae bacterium]